MSREASYRYSAAAQIARAAAREVAAAARRAEAEHRAAEWAKRTAEITQEHLARYQTILDDIRVQGLDEFVSIEFAEIAELVSHAHTLTRTDPAAAREVSRLIGPRIGPLPRTARQFRASIRAAQVEGSAQTSADGRASATTGRQARHASSGAADSQRVPAVPVVNPAEVAWQAGLSEWTDFLARDLAHGELTMLREQVGAGSITRPEEVTSRLNSLRARWESEAETRRQEETELLAMQQQQLVEEPPTQPDTEQARPDESDPAVDADPEDARREAVRAVMGSLEDAGFLVESPRLVKDSSGTNEVVVVGTRPSGASATFNLTLDGRLQYDFSGYSGSSCQADIDLVMPSLQEIYGIQLDDEVVIWRNPDDLDATARPQPGRTRNA